jgi:vacuolar-type H+-ATPase subunit I/STV1
MFAPVKMAEVDIFAFEDDIDAVAQTAARLGVIHLLDVNSLGKWAVGTGSEWPGRASSYATQERRVLELLDQLQSKRPLCLVTAS